ncbi:MAG: glycosyltransferase family 4 protein [Thermoproteota archaeon]
MKIVMVNVYFYPDMVGGAEWYVYNISRELVKMGHEVHVFTGKYPEKKDVQHPESIDGIRIHRVPLVFNITYRLKLWKNLEDEIIRENPDVVHTFDYAQWHSYAALKAASRLRVPSVLTVFDVHSMIPRPWYKQAPMRMLDWMTGKMVLCRADAVLVRAPNLVPFLLKMGVKKDRLIVTPSGIRTEALEPVDGSIFIQKYGITGRPIILYLGRLHPLKGLTHLFKAAPLVIKEFPMAVFVLVGQGEESFKKELVKLAKELGFERNVVFTDPIYDFQEKMSAYASCDVFVLPSGYEGTSQAIFEAMSQGKPIVSTRRGGIPFQVEDGKEALLVEYGDEKGLASSILRLLKDKETAREMGWRARRKVESFTYPALAKQVEEIYFQLSSARGRARLKSLPSSEKNHQDEG